MTTIHLLGSEGFIGQAIQREARGTHLYCWSHKHTNSSNYFDLLNPSSWDSLIKQRPKHVVLLSWPGLPNYNATFHLTHNLPACIELLEKLIDAGLERLVVTGTCYEYGLQNGELKESQTTNPNNCYGIAKDSLRRLIEIKCNQKSVEWCWLRIFYPYGQGQNQNSLLPSLDHAIETGNSTFEMGSGRQIRDFLSVEVVARHILEICKNPLAHGIYNSCTGNPRSIREIAEARIKEKSSNIVLQLGVIPDRADEPVAFWGCSKRINALMQR